MVNSNGDAVCMGEAGLQAIRSGQLLPPNVADCTSTKLHLLIAVATERAVLGQLSGAWFLLLGGYNIVPVQWAQVPSAVAAPRGL